MRTSTRVTAGVVLVCAALMGSVGVGDAHAQILWDTPRMIGPESPGGLGLHWMRAGALPGDGDAVFATLSLPGTGRSITLRGGTGEGANGEIAGFGGIDVRSSVARHTETQPLDVEWNAGAGVSIGDYQVISVPIGLSVGRSWSSGSVWLAPYVGASVSFDYRRGEGAPDEEFEVEPSGEVGIDLAFDAARRFVLRAATSLGDRQAVVVGLAIGGG